MVKIQMLGKGCYKNDSFVVEEWLQDSIETLV
jgi:hypothetical protein